MSSSFRALIKLGYSCNNKCIFCHAKPKQGSKDLATESANEKIDKAIRLGAKHVIFSGGEPTIRRDITELISYVKSKGLNSGIVTNARMLKYKDFLENMVSLGLSYVYVSLHGPEKIHNMITRTESFNQTLEGIKNVSEYPDIELMVNCVVTDMNSSGLEKIVDLLSGVRIDKIKFSLVEPINECTEIKPNITKAWKNVLSAIKHGEKSGFNMGFDGFPPCQSKKMRGLIDNMKTNNILFVSEAYEDDFFPSDSGNMIKDYYCEGCVDYDDCEGVYKEYLRDIQRPIKTGGAHD